VAEPPAPPGEREPTAGDEPGQIASTDPGAGAVAYVEPGAARSAMDRGKFLSGATIGVGALMGAVITVPALAAALAPAFKPGTFNYVDLGPADNFKSTSQAPFTVVTFDRAPQDPSGINRRVVFIRNDGKGKFTAISNTCMHVGCPVRNFGAAFACPCHGGQYDSEGRRTAGPPVRPLNRYENFVDSKGHLILGKLYAVDSNLHPHQLKGPGQPVTGVLSYLYPPAPQ
jgi:menaquinol-cytochrome c reductase iron-sulfur subunit